VTQCPASHVGDAAGEERHPGQPWDMVGNGQFKTESAPRPGELRNHANSDYGGGRRYGVTMQQSCSLAARPSGRETSRAYCSLHSGGSRAGVLLGGEGKGDRLAKRALYL